MSARYKLPHWLGGHECTIVRHHGDGRVTIRLDTMQATTVDLLLSSLVVIKAPILPEPTSGSAAATNYTVWLRGHGGWFDGFNTDTPAVFLTWEELNTKHPEVRALVYDPLTDAKPIPWSARDLQGRAVGIERFSNRFVFKHQTQMFPVETDIATAVEGAKAILRAARECAE